MPIQHLRYDTAGGITIQRSEQHVAESDAVEQLLQQLDSHRGLLLSSSFEYPGRYTRQDVGFVNPPIAITARDRQLRIESLNRRGRLLLPELHRCLLGCEAVRSLKVDEGLLDVAINEPADFFPEEQRSRQPSVFSALRAITRHFYSDRDSHLGLYGAFGYDLAFQFEPIELHQRRSGQDRDLVLYLPDELLLVDHHTRQARRLRYEFICRADPHAPRPHHADRATTGGLLREGPEQPYMAADTAGSGCDHAPGEYADVVRLAQQHFADGRLFEVVPGQVFHEPCPDSPVQVFRRLRQANPAPYGALINLGQQEYLVAASPEMYVRLSGDEVETCPISGTIARGRDALADERQIRTLLNSSKDEAELSMCTDVDRNDKSRVCVPGSVRVHGRRQIEMYSRLIHTVDHVKGIMAPQYDAFDAFLAHTWAVTVTGAPKRAAMQFIEAQERSPRHWYGGAIGQIGFDGNMNTGLTLRTIRICGGGAEIRAGATLLADSCPEEEEAETRLKASALLSAVRGEPAPDRRAPSEADAVLDGAENLRVLMVDHHDSFVHNLGSYFREFGVQLQTLRPQMARRLLAETGTPPDLVILSPGPGCPADFEMASTLALCEHVGIPVFGVCLGLQAIVEYCGGGLAKLDHPMHGKPSTVIHQGQGPFRGLSSGMTAGRYHSLHAVDLPDSLEVLARTEEEGVVMAVRHRVLPFVGVQFHPESIMTLEAGVGHRLIRNVLSDVLERSACDNQVQYRRRSSA